jgi:hypothetical protein
MPTVLLPRLPQTRGVDGIGATAAELGLFEVVVKPVLTVAVQSAGGAA